MNQRTARELVIQSLFQIDFSDCEPEAALSAAIDLYNESALKQTNTDNIRFLLNGIITKLPEIDQRITEFATGWTLDRMPSVDRNILRLAVYELFFADNIIDTPIIINEAVEIAKAYGTDDTPRFINGVLGKMVRTYGKS